MHDIKHMVTRNTFLAYPNFNEQFDPHTDASDYHIRALIIQSGKPTTFYTRKIIGQQNRYTVTEK